MRLAVLNFATTVADADVALWTLAIGKQLQEWATLWQAVPPSIGFYPKGTDAPPGSAPIALFDDADQSGFLGWHSESPTGMPYGKVFARAVAGQLPLSVVLSHECLEAAADAAVNLWADAGDCSYAYEICDPVEGDIYEIDGVQLSNFVTPAWFDPQADRGLKLDRLERLTAPFEMSRGGYVVRRSNATGVRSSVFGAEAPEFRKTAAWHPMTRATRRGVTLCLDALSQP